MYSFARRPLWILSHLVVASLILLAVALGFWQRSRYLEETAKQDRLEVLAARTPVPYEDAVDVGAAPSDVDPAVEFTRVEGGT